ncbi:response regulator [Modicisalibacter ilicicola]|uniref:response regulator n=1 Tax=Modicisalibacter ilicicola TaxID=480814 RepID=UPI000934CC53|nr:response regulator [Halomonas ilicicola]
MLSRRLLQAAGPLLVAEIGFSLICLAVGVWIWRDAEQRYRQELQRDLLQTHVVQANLIDQRLIEQQRHLRQLGRAVRRVLQTEMTATPLAPSAGDDGHRLGPEGVMALFGEVPASEDTAPPSRVRQLHRLEPLMNDLYLSDTLIERLYVALPQGLTALVPASRLALDTDRSEWQRYRFEVGESDDPVTPFRWHAAPQGPAGEAHLALQYDVMDLANERVAQLTLEFDDRRLARIIQEALGPDTEAWLLEAQGERLMGAESITLPASAGRRGVYTPSDDESLGSREASGQLVWMSLPTSGWRLVSRQASPGSVLPSGALLWVVLAWALGSLLMLGVLLLVMGQRARYWTRQLEAPASRVAGLARRVQALVPAWLIPSQHETPEPRHETSERLTARLDEELNALEASLALLRRQPRLFDLLETLDAPAMLTHHDRLVATNPAFERLVGHSHRELEGLNESLFLIAEDDADESMVRVKTADGHWRMMRRCLGDDEHGHGLTLLIDESESRYHAQQLSLARDRARQDSRLKSDYLALLRRELEALSVEVGRTAGLDERLRERGAMLLQLLDSLNEENGGKPSGGVVSQARPASETRSPRMLIVDDGPVNTALAHDMLSRHGLKVDTAAGGQEALDLSDRHFYDLVFMDIFMPPPDGIETTRRWRAREDADKEARRSVLVALTANASESDRERFFAAGMDDYLAKPYRPQALIDMIRRWLPEADIR